MLGIKNGRQLQLDNTGGDPLTEQRQAQHVPTVEEAAAAVLEQQRLGWRHARYERDWPRSLRAYAFPRIGGDARVRRDHGRRAGDPDPDLARQAGDRAASTATDWRRDEVGGGEGSTTIERQVISVE